MRVASIFFIHTLMYTHNFLLKLFSLNALMFLFVTTHTILNQRGVQQALQAYGHISLSLVGRGIFLILFKVSMILTFWNHEENVVSNRVKIYTIRGNITFLKELHFTEYYKIMKLEVTVWLFRAKVVDTNRLKYSIKGSDSSVWLNK